MNTSNTTQSNDEIDLFQLIETLWKERLFIGIITLVFSLIGLVFAFTTPPVYRASTNLIPLQPETQKRLEQLSLYSSIAPNTPLSEYLQLLNSSDIKEAFIQEAKPETRKEIYVSKDNNINIETLSSNLNITNNQDKKKPQVIFPFTISMNAPSKSLAEKELNRYLDFAALNLQEIYNARYKKLRLLEVNKLERAYKLENSQAESLRNNEITRLEETYRFAQKETQLKLNIAIDAAKKRHIDRIENLSEALLTASHLKITEPLSLSKMTSRNSEISVDVNNKNDLLYLRGTKLLSAELKQLKSNNKGYSLTNDIIDLEGQLTKLKVNYKIEQLKNRKDDLAFSEPLQEIKAKLIRLESEVYPDIELQFAHGAAKATPYRLKPKRSLIVVLATVIGGIIGILSALIRSSIRNRKTTKA
ncbi:MAG: Wzz/FepE/Etk N-terminal domain-containing protein [Neptuniibacter sp.]